MKSYRNVVSDNARWEDFPFRDGDIVISTPAKCGTTWTQMICALLVFQTPQLPKPLDQISPWLDMLVAPLDDVRALVDPQQHRRFIKSHTPLDGLPFDERVTYITVGRDPRDVAISMDNHMQNMDIDAFITQRAEAVGLDDLPELMPEGLPVRHDDPLERFWSWIDDPMPIGGLAGTLNHLATFWDARTLPNVVLLHYADLKADLEGQMRALAERLGIDVPEDRWSVLAKAACFEEMRGRAGEVAPNATRTIWHDTTKFFNAGTSGQWRALLDDAALERYAARVREMCDEELCKWVHQGDI